MTADLTSLAERLEGATGPDRELDAELHVRLLYPEYNYPEPVMHRRPANWQEAQGRLEHDGYGGSAKCPEYTSSIDAALALVERKLPIGPHVHHELSHGLARDGEEFWNFRIKVYDGDEEDEPTVHWGTAWTGGIAICLALVRALSNPKATP